jgi:arylsulfatase A-like enzyme
MGHRRGGLAPWRLGIRIVCALAAVLAAVDPLRADDARRPNVLVLYSDDQRADTIGALGNEHVRTPNLDRLVRRGTAFTRTYCMGSMQGAVCVPSRAMLLSGRTLFHVKENLQGQATWPEAFAQAGYSTFMTGKWHNQAPSLLRAFQRGRSIFLGGMGEPYTLPLQDITPEHTLTPKQPSGEHSIQRFADAAVEFIKEPRGETPFLCYVAFNVPHDPRKAPESYHARWNQTPPPLPANFLPQHPFNNGALVIRDEELAPWPRTPEVVRQHLADYYAAIEFLDAQVGRILEALESSGQAGRTLVAFASDHGLAIGSHGLFGKQNLYDHSMHSPLVFAGPGIPAGRRSDALCYLLDIFPTLGDLAGVPAPSGSEGLSLAPVLAGKEATRRDAILTAYSNSQRALRDDRWKLIVYPQINKTQLFDLRADPDERHDLAADPREAQVVSRLTAELRDWQTRLGDTQPLTSEHPKPQAFDFSTVKPARKK